MSLWTSAAASPRLLSLFAIGLACSGYACDAAPTALYAFAADEACEDLSCPLAVGAETTVEVSYDGVVDEVVISPAELATLTFDRDTRQLTITPKLVGTGELVVKADGDEIMVRQIETAELASTICRPSARRRLLDGWVSVYPDGTEQLYTSTMMRIVAFHRDAAGRSLLGHGIEEWSIDGASLRAADAPVDDELSADRPLLDTALARDIIADAGNEIRVTARVEASPLVLGVAEPGAAATLALEGTPVGEELRIGVDSELRPRLDVFDSAGRYIHGVPAGTKVEVEVGDREILTASAVVGRRAVYLAGRNAGTTTLTIRFDGREARYIVRVAR